MEYDAASRDAVGRILATDRNGVTSSFSYDTLDRLSGSTVPGQTATWGYDLAGNRTGQTVNGASKTLAYTVSNRLTSDGGTAVVHNGNGDVVQYGNTYLTWDARGRLTDVTDGTDTTTYTYDCFNRRTAKTVNGVTTRYVYLGWDLAVEADAAWSVEATYFYHPGVDRPISRTDTTGTYYYLQDLAGSVTALALPNGTLLGRYHYGPWGELLAADPGLPTQPLQWTAREHDENGLYYLRGRYHVPSPGRFLSEDPGGLQASLNLYTLAHNSPVGLRDPFGADAMPNGTRLGRSPYCTGRVADRQSEPVHPAAAVK